MNPRYAHIRTSIPRLLIANRGEPVMRAIRTCRDLLIEPAAVFCGADAASDWVAAAAYAYDLGRPDGKGPAPYLDGAKIAEIAADNDCAAVWPGWGFLSEDAAFAEKVLEAGLLWVGPPPQAMRLVGSKLSAAGLAKQAGFSVIPEWHIREGESPPAAEEIKFPVVIKPAAGGGGKGQAVVERAEDFAAAVEAAARLSRSLYGTANLIVQRFLRGARHIELQVLRDAFGSACVVGARDCSIQRRNQKVIEEAPAFAVEEGALAAAREAAKRLFAAAGYAGAGTVEMLLADGELFFLEVNARLQVEHTVTEESTRIAGGGEGESFDLLAEMLSIAAGRPLTFSEADLEPRGAAVEARIYAEDPDEGFAPTPGRIAFAAFPRGDGVRVDAAIAGSEGEVSADFDPMIAKVIASGATRAEAAARLRAALDGTVILGIRTNVDFLRRIISHPRFLSGAYTTAFIAEEASALTAEPARAGFAAAIAAIAAYRADVAEAFARLGDSGVVSLEDALARMPSGAIEYAVTARGRRLSCEVREWSEGRYVVAAEGAAVFFDCDPVRRHVLAVREASGRAHACAVHRANGTVQLVVDGEEVIAEIERGGKAPLRRDPHAAPCGGRLIAVCVREGQRVFRGDELYILEAMKMESRIRAIAGGSVAAVAATKGDAVSTGDVVVRVALDEAADDAVPAERLPLPPEGRDPVLAAILFPHSAPEAAAPLRSRQPKERALAAAACEGYFAGYDVPAEGAKVGFELLAQDDRERAVELVAACARRVVIFQKLKDEGTADLLLGFVKSCRPPNSKSAFRNILAEAFSGYRVALADREGVRRALPRLLAALRNQDPKHAEVLVGMIERLAADGAAATALGPAVRDLLACGLLEREAKLKARLMEALGRIDREEYYRQTRAPVALEYLDEYERFAADPLASLSDGDLREMRASLGGDPRDGGDWRQSLPPWLALLFGAWFEGFRVRRLHRGVAAAAAGVVPFELESERSAGEKRLVAVGIVEEERLPDPHRPAVFARIERTAIESYTLVAQYRAMGGGHALNHAILLVPPDLVLEWGEREGGAASLSAVRLKEVSSRIAGFARNIRILATEVLVNLRRREGPCYHIIEVRHTHPAGLVNRPPYLLSERMPESAKDARRHLDEKQESLGKLLNEDRARILFDGGDYEELSFPGCDDADAGPVGLRVYRGEIHGAQALAYAGDFRIRGGALGEREGKKLASAVVLAFASRMPLVGIHDGAGADIRGSVASLGWAGAYFGAIANTGGFSNEATFWQWFDGHLERPYFEGVLRRFGAWPGRGGRARGQHGGGRFVHVHLNLGATVGMLVYGASIGSMSIMADHPEVYRVLTGAATVKKVTGETSTNYGLGGADVHARHSGDVDVVCRTEEEAIGCARKVLRLLRAPPSGPMAPEGPSCDGACPVAAPLDPGSWIETRRGLSGAASLVTGYGAIGGRAVGIAAALSDYGIRNAASLKKLFAQYAGCQEFGVPLVAVAAGRWYNIPEGAEPRALAGRAECDRLFAALAVPRIAVAIGPRAIDEAIHHQADLCIAVRDGTESSYDVQRAFAAAHLVADDLPRAFRKISCVLPFLVSCAGEETAGADPEPLALPENFSEAYDVRAFLRSVVDPGSFLELHPGDGEPLVVGFAAAGGRAVGIIADDPRVASGAQTASALHKFTRFNRLCERFRIPLVEFNDSPGFMPGSRQERAGIQGEGGRSLREECLGTIPRLAVTLRQNYGGRFIHANLKTLGPGRTAFIAEGARVGVMGAEGAVGVLHEKKLRGLDPAEREKKRQELLQGYVRECLDPARAVELGLADRIIRLDGLREAVVGWVRKVVDRGS